MISKLKSLIEEYSVRFKMLADKAMGNKVIILDIEEISFIPYIFPIVKNLKNRTNRIKYYISTHYKGDESLRIFDVGLKNQFGTILNKKLNAADIFLSPHIYGKGHRDTVRIHINHNQPVKYESYQKEDFINFDIHFLTSPLHREQTENTIRKYNLSDNEIKLFDIGYPKSDDLLSGSFDRIEVLKELNLNPDNKTVLYAPSWDEGLSLRSYGDSVIENILKVKNINLIVKLHPISYCPENGPNYLFYTGGINWQDRFKKFESNINFRHEPMSKIDPLLAASDVMITDLSSVALEFIVLDKPVIYIDCPEFFEKTLKKVYSNFGNSTAEFVKNDPKANAGRHVGDVVYDINELDKKITDCLEFPERHSEKRREFSKKLIYNPGTASEKAADKILNILGL